MNWQKSLKHIKKIPCPSDLFNGVKGAVKKDEPLSIHTTFKIGGPAEFFAEPLDPDDLRSLVKAARKYKIRLSIIGAGSNLLVSDKGVNGLVIKLNSRKFKKLSFDKNVVMAGAGCSLSQVIKNSQKRGLSDAEFLAGIPGTVGGALVMNAGIPGKNISDLVEDIDIMDYNGNIKNLTANKVKFGYRKSNLSGYIILSASFRLSRNRKAGIQSAIKNYLDNRKDKQELSLPSAGCVFKNHSSMGPAGRLIDLCGLKGRRFGGACVSQKHANFIVNEGNATANDVSALMGIIKEEVKNKFKVILKPEIKIWQ